MAQPPSIDDYIRSKNAKKEANMTSTASMAKMFLAGSIFFLGLVIAGSVAYIGGKINQIQATTERALLIMDELPATAERAEKLISNAEASLKRSINEAKTAVPEVSKGLIDSFRNRNKPQEQPN